MRYKVNDWRDGEVHEFFAWTPLKIKGEWVWLERCWCRWIEPAGPGCIPACHADVTGHFYFGVYEK